jgi:hypothetical protein
MQTIEIRKVIKRANVPCYTRVVKNYILAFESIMVTIYTTLFKYTYIYICPQLSFTHFSESQNKHRVHM